MTTREDWLNKAAELLNPLIKEKGKETVKVHVSVGFPSKGGLSVKKKVIGQCWAASCSQDKVSQIFISPVLQEPLEVLATLLHEQIHAVVGTECGHKGDFAKLARAVGLEGKLTATKPGKDLTTRLKLVLGELGTFPHPTFSPSMTLRKVAATYLKKGMCQKCGYTIRITQKWLDIGLPTCPCGSRMVTENNESKED